MTARSKVADTGRHDEEAEPVDPKEAEQPLALPPQQVLDAVAAAAAKVVPLQFQAAAIGLDHLPLKFGDRLQRS